MRQIKFLLIAIVCILILGIFFNRNQWMPHSNQLDLSGNVDVRQVDLGFRAMGKLMLMRFKEGDWVKKGELMAALDKQPYLDKVNEAQAHMSSIEFSLKNALDLLKRREELLGGLGISKEDYDNARTKRDELAADLDQAQASLEAAKTNLKDTELFAPDDGIVLTRIREPGTIMKEGDPVYTLSLVSPVWVRVFIREPQLGLIYPGMPVEVIPNISEGKSHRGQIGFISPIPEFTPKSVETAKLRTELVYRVRVITSNEDLQLKQGMPVTVTFSVHPPSERTPGSTSAR